MEKQLIVIILAGGQGHRMCTHKRTHAVLQEVGELPMVVRVINEAAKLIPRKLIVVVNENELAVREAVRDYAIINEDEIEFINQGPSLGTGYAIEACRSKLKKYNNAQTLILFGNIPLVTHKIMNDIVKREGSIKVPYIRTEDPKDRHRIKIYNGKFRRIIVREECSVKELSIDTVCIGIFCIDNMLLCSNIRFVQPMCSGKYYIEDVVNIINKRDNIEVETLKIQLLHHIKVKSVVNREDLSDINNYVSALTLI